MNDEEFTGLILQMAERASIQHRIEQMEKQFNGDTDEIPVLD